ncbi:MAG: DDE-type integrase/transposase/recombinase, partial [Roseiflexus sp.]|nr:DDE-type integrase/transposase/recombinase [Roseiflexus sp.]
MEPCDRKTYSQRLQEAAVRLGKSKRTVRRWLQRWQREGLVAFQTRGRADKGVPRIPPDWQEFILKTYEQGNRGGKRMSVAQVYLQVRLKAQQEGRDDAPGRTTVYNFLSPYVRKQNQSLRSPGWKGSRLVLKTRDGQELAVEFSNQVWQCDHTKLDILLVDETGELLGRPWLTAVADAYSRCWMGFYLGFDAPSSAVVALALRHAILPKRYGPEYGLHHEWGTYGVPKYLYTDSSKDFRSQHLQQIGVQLGFVHQLRRQPADGGIVERLFKTLNTQLLATLPGYTGPNVQERPANAEKDACLMLRDLERLLVRYIVDVYNQTVDARLGDQTRFQRWESGLAEVPQLPTERELDLCL